jgi:hypothetical protein
MKDFFKYFLAQRMIKALLIGGSLLMAVFTYVWSKEDQRLNVRPFVYLIGLVLVLMIGYFISLKVEQWRTGKKQ